MNKKVISSVLAASMVLSLAACGSSASSAAESTAASSDAASTAATAEAGEGSGAYTGTPIKVGGIGPITGAAATYGNAVKNAEELAVKEINAANGSDVFDWKFEDDEHDAEKSVNAYNSLKDWGMQMLVGATTSKPCIAVSAETANDNMFQLTPSGSAVECVANDNVFRVCFADPDQGTASAKYIGENKLATKIAIIYDSSTEYSSGVRESFVKEAPNEGIEIVADEAFTADTNTDFSVQLDKAKEAGAELVFLPIYYQEASVILKQASDKGFDPIFFGCDGMDGILSVENFDTSLAEGLMLLTPFSVTEESSKKFTEDYVAAYGVEPNQFAADSYDAVYAIAAAVKQGGVTADMEISDMCEAMKKAMTEISIDGLTGAEMTWNAAGEPNKAPKAAKIVNGIYEMQ